MTLLTVGRLRTFYRRAGVRKKKVKLNEYPERTELLKSKDEQDYLNAREALRVAQSRGRRIVWID